jgi:hypothetical protein
MRFPHTRIPNVQSMVDRKFVQRKDARIFDTFDKPKFVLQNMGQAHYVLTYISRQTTNIVIHVTKRCLCARALS